MKTMMQVFRDRPLETILVFGLFFLIGFGIVTALADVVFGSIGGVIFGLAVILFVLYFQRYKG